MSVLVGQNPNLCLWNEARRRTGSTREVLPVEVFEGGEPVDSPMVQSKKSEICFAMSRIHY